MLNRLLLGRSWNMTRIQLWVGLIGIGVLLAMAILSPLIAPYDPIEQFVSPERLAPPSSEYLMGTDQVGRDLFSRLVFGTRWSLLISVSVLLISAVFGLALGAFAGVAGGIVDEIIMRITDVFFSFPYLILAMAIIATLGRGMTSLIVALGLIWWPSYTRLVRGQVLSIRERSYIEAARVIGNGTFGLITKHILPQTLAELLVRMSLDVGNIILVVSGLSFLGLGARPPTPEWGAIIGEGRPYSLAAPWIMLFPGIAIIFTILCFSMLGDALQDILQPAGSNR